MENSRINWEPIEAIAQNLYESKYKILTPEEIQFIESEIEHHHWESKDAGRGGMEFTLSDAMSVIQTLLTAIMLVHSYSEDKAEPIPTVKEVVTWSESQTQIKVPKNVIDMLDENMEDIVKQVYVKKEDE